MTSPSAAHTGIVNPRPVVDYGTNAAPSHDAIVELALAAVQPLIDAGHASWCPTCGGRGVIPVVLYGTRTQTCTRCQGARLNPFHRCTFLPGTDPHTGSPTEPCTCTDLCRVWALNRHGNVAPTTETTT